MTGTEYNPRDPREQWVELMGYQYRYRVSSKGRIQKKRTCGGWKTLKPYSYSGQYRISLSIPDGTSKRKSVSGLVADAFMGGTPPGKWRCHRNGLKNDNSVENIIFLTKSELAKMHRPGNSRPVVKLDRDGNVVAVYSSQSEAARANYISQGAISKRCLGQTKDPYRLDGHDYQFER